MALVRVATGLVDIQVAIAGFSGGLLTSLGHSDDMGDVSERAYFHNVPGDKNGGPQGPPIEIQYLGSIALINFTLSEFDTAVVDELRKRSVNATVGKTVQTEVGAFMLATRGIRLCMKSPTRPINFPTCIVREPIGAGMGTKYQGYTFSFEAHRTPAGAKVDVLFDSDVADP